MPHIAGILGLLGAPEFRGHPEFRDHDDDGIPPSRRSNLFGKTRERAAKFAQAIGEVTGRSPLVDMGIPASDFDETEIELLAHQPADPDSSNPRGETAPRLAAVISSDIER